MTCHMSLDLGGYVLHALEQREEYAVEQHLVECDECLEELGELAFAASLLALVQPEDAEMLDGPDPVEPASPPSAPSASPSGRPGPGRNVNHLRRRAVMAAVAAVVMGSAAVPAVHVLDGHDQPAQAVVLRGVGPAPRARAEVSLGRPGRGHRASPDPLRRPQARVVLPRRASRRRAQRDRRDVAGGRLRPRGGEREHCHSRRAAERAVRRDRHRPAARQHPCAPP